MSLGTRDLEPTVHVSGRAGRDSEDAHVWINPRSRAEIAHPSLGLVLHFAKTLIFQSSYVSNFLGMNLIETRNDHTPSGALRNSEAPFLERNRNTAFHRFPSEFVST